MLVHRSNLAVQRCPRPLQLRPALDKMQDRIFQGTAAAGAIGKSCSLDEVIRRASVIRDNQGNAAGSRLGGDHAKCFRLAAVDQGIRAREEPSKFVMPEKPDVVSTEKIQRPPVGVVIFANLALYDTQRRTPPEASLNAAS